jgi:hypothetical protein
MYRPSRYCVFIIVMASLTLFTGCDYWFREKYGKPLSPMPDEHAELLRRWEMSGSQPVDRLRLDPKLSRKFGYHFRVPVVTPEGTGLFLNRIDFGSAPDLRTYLVLGCRSEDFGVDGIATSIAVGEIFPLFNQLYLVEECTPDLVSLKRVTEQIPESLLPDMNSRKLLTSDWDPEFRRGETVKTAEGTTSEDYVELSEFNIETGEVTLTFIPHIIVERASSFRSDHDRISVRFQAGDTITVRKNSYHIEKVVAPQAIANVGKIVGWIEYTRVTKPIAPPQDQSQPAQAFPESQTEEPATKGK